MRCQVSKNEYKFRQILAPKSTYSKEIIVSCEFKYVVANCQKVPKSDFQSQFSNQKSCVIHFSKNINLGTHFL